MKGQSQIRLLVCHRDALLAAGLKAILRADPDILVMDGDDAASAQVIVSDLDEGLATASRPGQTVVETRAIPKVLVYTSRCSEADVRAALRAGVLGYLVQGCSPQDTIQAVRDVHGGARYFCPLASKRMADSLAHSALTEREIEVLNRLADGLSNKLIARHFDLAVDTVKAHVGSILGKLGASNRTHAVAVARDRGLVQRTLVGVDRL